MTNSDLSISVIFDLTESPKVFNVTDSTNYSGVVASNKLGNIRAISPSGSTFHNNISYVSPDINYGSDPTSDDFPLPNPIVAGNYQFIYTVKVEDELMIIPIVGNNSGANTIEISGNWVSKINDGTATAFQCVSTVTTSLTIVSATYDSGTGLTTVTVGQTLGTLDPSISSFRFTVDNIYTKTFQQSYTYTSPTVCLNWESDECCSSMTITDETVYPDDATVTRLHTVSYPDGMVTPIADITSPLQALTISPIWTGTWTDVFTASYTVSLAGIISVTDSLRGVKEFLVSGNATDCQIYSCMKNITLKYADQLFTAPTAAIETGKQLLKATSILSLYQLAKKCGEADAVDFLAQIKTIADTCGCSCDCEDCADDTPTQVVGCCENVGGTTNTIVITSNGGTITVASNTVGSTTTFNVEVDEDYLTTFTNALLADTSIGIFEDVDLTTPPTAGQVFKFNGTKWVAGSAVGLLTALTDVNTTGLANNMYMYYDSGTQTFKFRLITFTLNDLSDVIITAASSGQIIKYNGTNWVNVANTFDLLSDVNTAGKADGDAFKWDAGTSKYIPYAPLTSLDTLTDVVITTAGLAQSNVLIYDAGTSKWINQAKPTYTTESNTSFAAGFTNTVGGQYPVGIRYSVIDYTVKLRGVVANSNGAAVIQTTLFTIANTAFWPTSEIPFITTGGIGGTPTIVGGSVSALGVVSVAWFIATATGIRTAGMPAGDVDMGQVPGWQI